MTIPHQFCFLSTLVNLDIHILNITNTFRSAKIELNRGLESEAQGRLVKVSILAVPVLTEQWIISVITGQTPSACMECKTMYGGTEL